MLDVGQGDGDRAGGGEGPLGRALLAAGLLSPAALADCALELERRRARGIEATLVALVLERRLVSGSHLATLVEANLAPPGATPASPGGVTVPAASAGLAGPSPARHFGPFRPVRELGRGGMGQVLEVQHAETGARYALKLLGAGMGGEERLRFQREAQLLARLDHPHVLQIHSAALDHVPPYLVQDLLTGGSLAERLLGGPLACEDVLELGGALASALSHAHAQGVLHRDLKPENVLFDERGQARLADFGLARAIGASLRLTATGTLLGTPAFMAPEQASGARDAGPATDVYGLGAVLYAAACARPPFPSDRLFEVLEAVLHEAPLAPSGLRDDALDDVGQGHGVDRRWAGFDLLIRAMLAKVPDERPPLGAVGDALGALRRGDPGPARALAGLPASAAHRRRARAAGVVLLVALLGGVAYVGGQAARRSAAVEALGTAEAWLDATLPPGSVALHASLDLPPADALQARADALRQAAAALDADERAARARALAADLDALARLALSRAGAPAAVTRVSPLGGSTRAMLLDALVLAEGGAVSGARRHVERALLDDPTSDAGRALHLELRALQGEPWWDEVAVAANVGAGGAEEPDRPPLGPVASARARRLLPAALERVAAAKFDPKSADAVVARSDWAELLGAATAVRLPTAQLRAILERVMAEHQQAWKSRLVEAVPERREHLVLQRLGNAVGALRARGQLPTWLAEALRQLEADLSPATPDGPRTAARDAQLARALRAHLAIAHDLDPRWAASQALIAASRAVSTTANRTTDPDLFCGSLMLLLRSGDPPFNVDVLGHMPEHAVAALQQRYPRSRAAALVAALAPAKRIDEQTSGEECLRLANAINAVAHDPDRADDLGPDGAAELHARAAALLDNASRRLAPAGPSAPEQAERAARLAAIGAQLAAHVALTQRVRDQDLPRAFLLVGRAARAAYLQGDDAGAVAAIQRELPALRARLAAAPQSESVEELTRLLLELVRALDALGRDAEALTTVEEALRLAELHLSGSEGSILLRTARHQRDSLRRQLETE